MRSSSGAINVAASAPKINVDNRISLRYYYRIADNILRQAAIFREERNIIDLYVLLLRFSSLATETIPFHRDYRTSVQRDKQFLKKKLVSVITELEKLQPVVRLRLQELSGQQTVTYQSNGWSNHPQTKLLESSKSLPSIRQQPSVNNYAINKYQAPPQVNGNGYGYQDTRIQMYSPPNPLDDQTRQFSLNIPRAREETLSRHSILGPNGLCAQWQAPTYNVAHCTLYFWDFLMCGLRAHIRNRNIQLVMHPVRYPSNIDLSPVEFPREKKLQLLENGAAVEKITSNLEQEKPSLESIITPKNNQQPHIKEPDALISFEEKIETPPPPPVVHQQMDIIRQPSPPPVLAEVQDLIPTTTTSPPLNDATNTGVIVSESPLELHISTKLMDNFMKMAKSNTDKNLETCGILAGSLKNRKFYVTALIIPKQEATTDSCQATNEEEIFEVQDKRSLFPLGWIHTHPTQSCFMSSIDVHTHYAYQIMLPEAIAIVMAPRDSSRKHGIFRLTTPGGMGVIRNCPHRGFHAHDAPSDGSPIYKQCTDVYIDPKLNFDVIDLR